MSHTNYIKSLIVSLTILILTTIVNVSSQAETATSGNLLPNAGDGKGALQSSSSTLDNTNQNSGFTLNGIGSWNNELEASGTGTVSATGSLENITTTTQSGNSHTTTTTSLDGGVTLNATTEIQNCEWQGSAYQCGNSRPGRDSYSTTIKILDENENVLTSTSITRNNDAGYYSNAYTYTDTVTHNDTGARKWDWEWQGIDGNNPNTGAMDGPNLLGASLTATLLDITYQPAPLLSTNQQTEIINATGLVEEAIEEIKFEEFEEIKFEEIKFEEPKLEEVKLEEVKIEEVKLEEFNATFEENFKEILVKENLIEEFETALVQENITEEEFFEEAAGVVMEELKEEFKSSFEEEPNVITQKPETETIKEEEFEEIKEEKTEEGELNATETTTNEKTETEEIVQGNEEEDKTGPKDENVSAESEVDNDKETEGQTETEDSGETVEDETGVSVENGKTLDAKVSSITEKVARVIKKLEEKLKRVDDKLNATAYVLAVGLQSTQPDISSYSNKRIYENNNIGYETNDDFFDLINRIEQQQIYKDATLSAYTSNDPIAVQSRLLNEIDQRKAKLKAEIAALRSM